MHFDLTDDQKMLRDQLAGMLADRLPETALMKLYDAEDSFDEDLWTGLSEMGLGGILVAEDKGGIGMGLLTLAVVAEELGYAGAPAPVAANAVAAWLLAETGHADLVASLVAGEAVAAFALSAERGWRPSDWSLDGDRASGTIDAVELGARASLFIVGLAGGKLGLVRSGQSGVSVVPVNSVDRTRPVAELVLDGAQVEVLAADGALVDRLLDALSVVTAADAVGAANRSITMAVEYAKVRKQFDKLIGQFQGLKYQLVDAVIEVQPCRPLVWYAAHAWDAIPAEAARNAAIAKAHATEVAVRTARVAVEAHGGIGYTWEYPLHVWLKRGMQDRTLYGLPAVHRARAAELAGW